MYNIYNSFDLATFSYIEYLNQVSLVISYFFYANSEASAFKFNFTT